MTEQSTPFFALERVQFAYAAGEPILRAVDLAIRAGEMTALIGPNGAGKSTLLHIMAGLLAPSTGSARIEAHESARMEPTTRARRVGFVPQTSAVFFPYTVAEIIGMGRNPRIGPFSNFSAVDRERIEWAMEMTGVSTLARRMFNQISGGEAQRVVLARALAQDAPALLLDEPTSSLDLYYQAALYGLLEKLNRQHGRTVVIVTHDINLAAEYCTRLVGLRAGEIVLDGPPEQIVTTEAIQKLYGVQAQILTGTGEDGKLARMVRVRHQS